MIMEATFFFLLFASVLLLLLPLLLLKNHSSRLRQVTTNPPPPGPWKLPIIGSLHHLLGAQAHQSLNALSKRFGPIMLLKLGELHTLVVSSAEAAAEITKTQDLYFANRPMFQLGKFIFYGEKSILFAPYGDYWRELHKLAILELLSTKRVKSFRTIREEEVMKFVQWISHTGTVNLSEKIMVLSNDIITRAIIGRKCKYQKEFLRILEVALRATEAFCLSDLFPSVAMVVGVVSGWTSKLQRLHLEFDAILGDIIEEHRKKEKERDEQVEEDMMDVMLKLQREGTLSFPFTDESIKSLILDLFGAGSETTPTVMEWVMSELIRNPRVMRRVQEEVREKVGEKRKVTDDDVAEMSYLKLVVKETLRLHPPLPILPRQCQESRELLGYWIPANTRVFINVWALGRDPCYWDYAAEFRPERFNVELGGRSAGVDMKGTNFEFLPFGAGRRMCPGMTFGLASVELLLACLLYYFDWEMPEAMRPNELDMEEAFVVTCRRKSELYLRAIPHPTCVID